MILCPASVKSQRRSILKERRSIRDSGIRIREYTGAQLADELMDLMFDYYRSTNWQFGPWAAFFLNRDWFRRAAKGRGAREYIRYLHFELCCYAPVGYTIRHKIDTFDSGMKSLHKARRGFVSRRHCSYHVFTDQKLLQLFESILPAVSKEERDSIELLNNSVPWKANQ